MTKTLYKHKLLIMAVSYLLGLVIVLLFEPAPQITTGLLLVWCLGAAVLVFETL